ncbi:MAG: peptidase S41, partial [Tangfeifania sp.]
TRDLDYNTKLKVTTAKYYIPSGRCIQTLDYSYRNEDGSVGEVPDSLITEFTTKKGRKVYDGGGIVPDIVLEPDQLSNLSIALITNYMVFDFATKFANENESIASPEEFYITADIYNQFSDFVKGKEFDYESKSKDVLKDLIEAAKEERYYGLAEEDFETLKTKLEPKLDKDLKEFKEEIKSLLENEIVTRYYYQKGAIRSSIDEDKVIIKALEELKSPMAYNHYFEPGTIISMKE